MGDETTLLIKSKILRGIVSSISFSSPKSQPIPFLSLEIGIIVFLCRKMNHYEQDIHSPHRLLTPLKRIGEKGNKNSFVPTSW